MNTAEMTAKIAAGNGFIAALDQSGGSTPKALEGYGIGKDAWKTDEEMFALMHAMRARIIKSPAFNGDRVIGAILFERTMDGDIDGKPVPFDALEFDPLIASGDAAGAERAAPGQFWYWLNLGNYRFANRKVITDMPVAIGGTAVIRWADVNGNGTFDAGDVAISGGSLGAFTANPAGTVWTSTFTPTAGTEASGLQAVVAASGWAPPMPPRPAVRIHLPARLPP